MPPAKYFVPNAVTAASLLIGLGSVMLSAAGHFELAAWMILWGCLLDKLDGAAARLLNASSGFGMEFDSFADFVSFGLAPAALLYFRMHQEAAVGTVFSLVPGLAAGLYVLALAVRLARFNITPGDSARFEGVPGTLLGGVVGSGYLTWALHGQSVSLSSFAPAVLVIGAILMVSSLSLPKLGKRKGKFFNAFQIANVAAAYAFAPLRIFPEYLLGIGLTYLVGGLLAGLSKPTLAAGAGPDEQAQLPA